MVPAQTSKEVIDGLFETSTIFEDKKRIRKFPIVPTLNTQAGTNMATVQKSTAVANKDADAEFDPIDEQRKKLITRGLCGLKNIGNTCYMNASLQCLSAVTLFSSYVRSDRYMKRLESNAVQVLSKKKRTIMKLPDNHDVSLTNKEVDNYCIESVVYQLSRLFETMWANNSTITPKSFKAVIGSKCEIFRGAAQNDSQELINLILDRIHEETKQAVDVSFRNVPPSVNALIKKRRQCMDIVRNKKYTLEEREEAKMNYIDYRTKNIKDFVILQAYTYWKKSVEKSHSIITDLFTGLFYSRIECGECKNETASFEPFTIISIPTNDKGTTSLKDCLKEFSKEENLTGDNQYHCDKCKKKVDATKKLYIWEPPEVLIVQLKRFKNDKLRSWKTESKVEFPMKDLELTDNYSEIYQRDNCKYDLYGIVEHRGSLNFGHYVAYCKNGVNKRWYEFNDSSVFHVPDDDITKEVVTEQAYILFYVRNTD